MRLRLSIQHAWGAVDWHSRTARTSYRHPHRYGGVSPHQKTVMTIDNDQRRILHDIDATTPISESETDWAVNAGYAVLAEDGDIDLTNEGRALLDAS